MIPPILIIVGIVFFHWRGIRPGYTFLPIDLARSILPWSTNSSGPLQNWLISDPLYQYYPFLTSVTRSLQQFRLLLWDPTIFLGHPASADPLYQIFYPGTALFALVLGVERGLAISLVSHVILSGLLMYGMLRSLKLARPGAVAGAFTYALSGYMVTWFETPFWINTMAWLPGVLWAYHLALTQKRWLYVALGAGALGCAILAGQFQFMAIFGAFLFFLSLYQLGWQYYVTRHFSAWSVFVVLGIFVIGVSIGAAQLFPFIEFLPWTRRDVSQGLGDRLPIAQTITLLLPNFFGNPTQSAYWGSGNYSGSTFYFGIVALVIGVLGIGAKPRLWSLFLTLSFVGVVYYVLGGPGVSLLSKIPIIRNTSLLRSLFILPLISGWLLAIALSQAYLSPKVAGKTIGVVAVIALAASYLLWRPQLESNLGLFSQDLFVMLALMIAIWLLVLLRTKSLYWKAIADWSLVGLVFINLYWYGNGFNPVGKVNNLMPDTSTVDYLQNNAGMDRVVTLQRNGDVLFGPNLLSISNVMEPGGYSSLVSSRLHALISRGDPEIDLSWAFRKGNVLLFSNPSERLLDLFSVRFLASSEEIYDPGPVAEVVVQDCSAQIELVSTGAPVSGSFEVWRTAINRIDLAFSPLTSASQIGQVRFNLWRNGATQTMIVDYLIPISDIVNVPKQTIYFSPEEDAPGLTYAWQLTVENSGDDLLHLCTDAAGVPAISVYGTQLAEMNNADGVRIYRRFAPFYRASVVYGADFVKDDDEAIAQILNTDFDLRNTVITATPTDLPRTSVIPATQATIVEYIGDQIRIQATARQEGLLVLTDLYDPQWVATVDGESAEILRLNHVMRGVMLTPGDHEIVFRYEPRSVQVGILVSLAGIAVVLGSVIVVVVRIVKARMAMSASRKTI